MNNNAKLWVENLRSGEYKQLKGHLSDDEAYCCLGLACELAIKNGLNITRTCVTVDGYNLIAFGHQTKTLPYEVAAWLGFRVGDVVGSFTKENDGDTLNSDSECLSRLNDSGKSFAEIADVIEANQDKLFVKDQQEGINNVR